MSEPWHTHDDFASESDESSNESDFDSDTSSGSDISSESDGKLSRSSGGSGRGNVGVGAFTYCLKRKGTASVRSRSNSSTGSGGSASSISSITGSSAKGTVCSARANRNATCRTTRNLSGSAIPPTPTASATSNPTNNAPIVGAKDQNRVAQSKMNKSYPLPDAPRIGDSKKCGSVAASNAAGIMVREDASVAIEQLRRLGGRRASEGLPQVLSVLKTHGAHTQVAEQGLAAILRALSDPETPLLQDQGDVTIVVITNVIKSPNASGKSFIRGAQILAKVVCEGCSRKKGISVEATTGVQAIVHGIGKCREVGDMQALAAGLDAATELASRSTLRPTLITAGAHVAAAEALRSACLSGDKHVASSGLQCLWNLRAAWQAAETQLVLSAVLSVANQLGPKSHTVIEGVAKVLWLLAATPEVCSPSFVADSVKILQKLKTFLGNDAEESVLPWVERSIARISAAKECRLPSRKKRSLAMLARTVLQDP